MTYARLSVDGVTHSKSAAYDALYAQADDHILWGQAAGRLLRELPPLLHNGDVLDAGCGDGKNALFLEHRGYQVTGIDSSVLAISGLRSRFERAGIVPSGHYEAVDLELFLSLSSRRFDCIVSYGLYHCLKPARRIHLHQRLQDRLRPGGVLLFTTLTDATPLPDDHGTPDIWLSNTSELRSLLTPLSIERWDDDEITEDHLPLVQKHRHSASWIIARRP